MKLRNLFLASWQFAQWHPAQKTMTEYPARRR